MVASHPQPISGRWREGYALDLQTLSSTYVGDNQYGRPDYDTKRTELGELLYKLKYGRDRSVVSEIADTVASFVQKG